MISVKNRTESQQKMWDAIEDSCGYVLYERAWKGVPLSIDFLLNEGYHPYNLLYLKEQSDLTESQKSQLQELLGGSEQEVAPAIWENKAEWLSYMKNDRVMQQVPPLEWVLEHEGEYVVYMQSENDNVFEQHGKWIAQVSVKDLCEMSDTLLLIDLEAMMVDSPHRNHPEVKKRYIELKGSSENLQLCHYEHFIFDESYQEVLHELLKKEYPRSEIFNAKYKDTYAFIIKKNPSIQTVCSKLDFFPYHPVMLGSLWDKDDIVQNSAEIQSLWIEIFQQDRLKGEKKRRTMSHVEFGESLQSMEAVDAVVDDRLLMEMFHYVMREPYYRFDSREDCISQPAMDAGLHLLQRIILWGMENMEAWENDQMEEVKALSRLLTSMHEEVMKKGSQILRDRLTQIQTMWIQRYLTPLFEEKGVEHFANVAEMGVYGVLEFPELLAESIPTEHVLWVLLEAQRRHKGKKIHAAVKGLEESLNTPNAKKLVEYFQASDAEPIVSEIVGVLDGVFSISEVEKIQLRAEGGGVSKEALHYIGTFFLIRPDDIWSFFKVQEMPIPVEAIIQMLNANSIKIFEKNKVYLDQYISDAWVKSLREQDQVLVRGTLHAHQFAALSSEGDLYEGMSGWSELEIRKRVRLCSQEEVEQNLIKACSKNDWSFIKVLYECVDEKWRELVYQQMMGYVGGLSAEAVVGELEHSDLFAPFLKMILHPRSRNLSGELHMQEMSWDFKEKTEWVAQEIFKKLHWKDGILLFNASMREALIPLVIKEYSLSVWYTYNLVPTSWQFKEGGTVWGRAFSMDEILDLYVNSEQRAWGGLFAEADTNDDTTMLLSSMAELWGVDGWVAMLQKAEAHPKLYCLLLQKEVLDSVCHTIKDDSEYKRDKKAACVFAEHVNVEVLIKGLKEIGAQIDEQKRQKGIREDSCWLKASMKVYKQILWCTYYDNGKRNLVDTYASFLNEKDSQLLMRTMWEVCPEFAIGMSHVGMKGVDDHFKDILHSGASEAEAIRSCKTISRYDNDRFGVSYDSGYWQEPLMHAMVQGVMRQAQSHPASLGLLNTIIKQYQFLVPRRYKIDWRGDVGKNKLLCNDVLRYLIEENPKLLGEWKMYVERSNLLGYVGGKKETQPVRRCSRL